MLIHTETARPLGEQCQPPSVVKSRWVKPPPWHMAGAERSLVTYQQGSLMPDWAKSSPLFPPAHFLRVHVSHRQGIFSCKLLPGPLPGACTQRQEGLCCFFFPSISFCFQFSACGGFSPLPSVTAQVAKLHIQATPVSLVLKCYISVTDTPHHLSAGGGWRAALKLHFHFGSYVFKLLF